MCVYGLTAEEWNEWAACRVQIDEYVHEKEEFQVDLIKLLMIF